MMEGSSKETEAQLPSERNTIRINPPGSQSQAANNSSGNSDQFEIDSAEQSCPNSLYGCQFKGSDRQIDQHLTGGDCEKQILREKVTKKEVELNQLKEEVKQAQDELLVLKRELWGSDYDPSVDYSGGDYRTYGYGENEYPHSADQQRRESLTTVDAVAEKLQKSFTWGSEWFNQKLTTVKQSDAYNSAREKTSSAIGVLDEKLGEIKQSETFQTAKQKAAEAATVVGEAAQKGTSRVKDLVSGGGGGGTEEDHLVQGPGDYVRSSSLTGTGGYGSATAYRYET
eukprot:Nk52_evm1s519 gene=Nk52_evmTU1s519